MREGPPEVTTDRFLGGQVTLLQPRQGHRAGLDAAVLQAVVPADATGVALDLGAGVGTIAFSAAARAPGLRCIGIERDAAMIELAAAAMRLPENAGIAERVRFVAAEVNPRLLSGDDPDLFRHCADWVLMNPPFDEHGEVRASPAAGKRHAYLADPGTIETWIGFAAEALRPGGWLALIHRPAALPRILAALEGFGDARILPVHPRSGDEANRVIVSARAGSRAPLRIRPGLILHAAGGGWTPETDRILRGLASLPE